MGILELLLGGGQGQQPSAEDLQKLFSGQGGGGGMPPGMAGPQPQQPPIPPDQMFQGGGGMPSPEPAAFNPGLREGQNYPMTDYWNVLPPGAGRAQPDTTVPPGWLPPQEQQGPDPEMIMRMLRDQQRARPTPPRSQPPGRIWGKMI